MESLPGSIFQSNQPFTQLGILLALTFLTYWHTLRCGWTSDDCAFSGPDAKPISTYEGKLQRPLSWANLCKKWRWLVGRVPTSNLKWQAEKQSPYQNLPRAHHRLNLWLSWGVSSLFYLFLRQMIGDPLAFLTVALWTVHPLGCQTIAWVSGINYLLGAFWMGVGLNLILLAQSSGWLTTPEGVFLILSLFAVCQWLAAESLYQMVGVIPILLWMQAWPFAIVATLLAIVQAFHTFRDAVTLRRKVFHEQQMGASTRFTLGKLVVVPKLLWYNFGLAIFPKRLGLYHKYLYHYDLPHAEYEDRNAFYGLLLGVGLISSPLIGSTPLTLGSLWFLSFLALFCGWIIANQAVVDRYVWLPSLGVCLLVSHLLLLTNLLWLYSILFGILLMRTWVHLPTYQDEDAFYQSNIFNFPTSEVAYGNLGVVCIQQGWIGRAMEAWVKGIDLNPEYDVCWYNLASALRSRGPLNPNYLPRLFQLVPKEVLELALNRDPQRQHLHLAAYCLHRAVTARTCHFPKPWEEELRVMQQELSRPIGAPLPSVPLIRPLLTAALT